MEKQKPKPRKVTQAPEVRHGISALSYIIPKKCLCLLIVPLLLAEYYITPPTKSSRHSVPLRWDAREDKWVIDIFELETRDGEPVPIRWDAEKDEWVIDVFRL